MTRKLPHNSPTGFSSSRGTLVPLRSQVELVREKVSPAGMEGRTVTHYSIPAVQEFGTAVEEDGGDIASDKWVISRPVVLISRLNPRKATVVLAAPSSELTVASSEFVAVTSGNSSDDRYLAYILGCEVVTRHLDSLVTSVTRSHQRVSPRDILSLGIPWPVEGTRHSIADFLDRETAQIDALIEAQERLVGDLEFRQIAIIAHFTDAESNGWPEGRVNHLGCVTLGKMLSSGASSPYDTEQMYLRAANVQPLGVLDLADVKTMWFTPAEVTRLDLREGDVLVVEGGQGGFGRAAYLDRNLPDTGFQNSINRVRMCNGNLGRFLSYALIAARAAGLMHALCPAVSMPHMTAEKLAVFPVATPSPAEQHIAAARIDAAMEQTGRTIAAAREVIMLLRERREALITAAVTGRIDPETGIERIDPTTYKEAS